MFGDAVKQRFATGCNKGQGGGQVVDLYGFRVIFATHRFRDVDCRIN